VTPALAEVRFLNVPVELMFNADQHHQELVREFALIQLSDDSAKQDVPARLLEVVDRERRQFSILAFRRTDELVEAIKRGDPHIDMEIAVPPDTAGPAALAMMKTLGEADEFCRRGALLTLATPPEYVAFREWFFGEIVRQLDGKPPRPWRDSGAS
jgi:hypothetical protein